MGNLLSEPVTDKETEEGKTVSGLHYASSSMQGWRTHMEDAHICQGSLTVPTGTSHGDIQLDDHSLFAVFDGHRGSFAAKFSAKHFLQILVSRPSFIQYAIIFSQHKSEQVEDKNHDDKQKRQSYLQMIQFLEQGFKEAFLKVDVDLLKTIECDDDDDKIVLDSQQSHPIKTSSILDEEGEINVGHSGTTALVVFLTPSKILCANAGDSRAIYSKRATMYDPNTKTSKFIHRTIPLSYDHKPNDEHEHSRIVMAGGYVSDNRVDGDLAVSRGLGDFRFKCNTDLNPEKQKLSAIPDFTIQTRNQEDDECVVLACDGIWDVCSNPEVIDNIHQMIAEGERRPGLMCEEMMDMCLMKGSKDNMTVTIVLMPGLKYTDKEGNQRSVLADLESCSDQESDSASSTLSSSESSNTSGRNEVEKSTAVTQCGWSGGIQQNWKKKRNQQQRAADDDNSEHTNNDSKMVCTKDSKNQSKRSQQQKTLSPDAPLSKVSKQTQDKDLQNQKDVSILSSEVKGVLARRKKRELKAEEGRTR